MTTIIKKIRKNRLKLILAIYTLVFLISGQALSAQTVLFSEDFSDCSGNVLLPACGWNYTGTLNNQWFIPSASCIINGNSLNIADNLNNPCAFTDNKATNIVAYKTTGSFTTLCHTSVTIAFNYKVGGSVNDYGMVMYCLGSPENIGSWVNIVTGGDGSGRYYGNGSLNSASISLPGTALNQGIVYIGFRWYNDASNNSALEQGFAVDDIVVTGLNPIAPSCASGFMPVNGSTLGCGSSTTLLWAANSCATNYKIYLGHDNPPTTLVATQSSNFYSTPVLDLSSTYYWKIVPVNSVGEASGCPVNSFNTAAATINPPLAPDVSRCNPGTLTLNASGGTYPNYFWFDESTGGNLLSISSSYTTPSLSSTRSYYVSDALLDAETSLSTGTTGTTTCISAVANSAQLFNLSNVRNNSLVITQLTVGNLYTSGTCNAQVFYRSGTYVGNETSSQGWTSVFNGTVTRATTTTIDVSDFVIPSGATYGIYVYFTGDPSYFKTGAGSYSNADIMINTGSIECEISAPFTLGTGALYANYSMVGSVFYKTVTCKSERTICQAIINSPSTPALSIASGSGNIICSGSMVTFTATPTNGGTSPAYQWYVGATPVATGSTFSTSTLSNGNVITCVLTPSADACPSPATATSNALTASVLPSSNITTQPADKTLCQNGSTNFTIVADNGPYQWQVSTNGGTSWTNISAAGSIPTYGGYTTATLTLTGVDDPNNGYKYRCLAGCTPSQACLLTVNPVTDPIPGHNGSCNAGSVTLSASGANINENYKWYTTATGGIPVLENASSYPTPVIAATTTYYVTKYNTVSPFCESYPRTPVIATIYTAPIITTQPANVTVSIGSTTSFSIIATGNTLTYQWQVSTNGGAVWNNISTAGSAPTYSGWTSNTLILSGVALSNNNYQYKCLVTGICAHTTNSNAAVLTVSSAAETYLHPTTGAQFTYMGTCMESTCSGTYYDNGGAGSGYATNVNSIYRTFCPNEAQKAVRATVTAMDIAYASGNCNDLLYIQNGPNQAATTLWAGCGTTGAAIYTSAGTYNGGIITSTHQSGCLTFRFSSGTTNSTGTWDGWNIALSCVNFPGGPSGTANTDCINSTPICNDISASSFTYGPGITSDACTGCVTSENFVEWYRMKMATSGTIELEIVPNGVSDLDFAFYKASNCGSLGDPLRCSYAARTSPGKTGMKISSGDISEDVYGNQWVNEVNAVAGETYYLMVNEWNKPNPNQYTLNWTLTNGASFDCNIILPVDMLDFYAERRDDAVDVKWVTASETNNDFFSVERSSNGKAFSEIARVDGAGNSNAVVSYSFTDEFPIYGTGYYRIKQTDYDGKTEYTQAVAVNFNDPENSTTMSLFPNPADQYITVQTNRFMIDQPFEIYNALGICVMKGVLSGTLTRILLDDLTSGGIFILNAEGIGREKFYVIQK